MRQKWTHRTTLSMCRADTDSATLYGTTPIYSVGTAIRPLRDRETPRPHESDHNEGGRMCRTALSGMLLASEKKWFATVTSDIAVFPYCPLHYWCVPTCTTWLGLLSMSNWRLLVCVSETSPWTRHRSVRETKVRALRRKKTNIHCPAPVERGNCHSVSAKICS